MKERVVELYLKWEPNSEGDLEGQEHIFAKIVQSEIPFIQEKKYLCERTFTEVPEINAVEFEQFFESAPNRVHLTKNFCKECWAKMNKKFPFK